MLSLKNKDSGASPQVGELRQSLARLSNNNFGGIGGGPSPSHLSINGVNTSSIMNRNSNIKKVIRGGNGSFYQKSRASTLAPDRFVDSVLGQPNQTQADVNYVNTLLNKQE